MLDVPLIEFSEAYLHYIRRQNPIAEGAPNAEQTRGVITKAYEFALKECGTDRESGEVWQEYIDFINNASVSGITFVGAGPR